MLSSLAGDGSSYMPGSAGSAGAAHNGEARAFELGNRTIAAQVQIDRDDEVGVDRGGQLLEGLQRDPATGGLHASDRRLGRSHAPCELALGEPGPRPNTVDQTAKRRQPHLLLPSRPHRGGYLLSDESAVSVGHGAHAMSEP